LPRLAADPISSRPAVEAAMQRYGLQLRTKPAASSSSRAPPPPARPLAAFADDDDDDVEAEILRQAAKKRALQKVTRYGHHPMRTFSPPFMCRAVG
jgi:hypothetical protein